MKNICKMLQFNAKKTIVAYVVINMVTTLFALLNPYVTKGFIDSLVAGTQETFILLIVLIFCLYILNQICGYISDILRGKSEENVWRKIIRLASDSYLTYDPKERKVDSIDANQQLGQSYELVKNFSAYYPVQLIVYIAQEIGIIFILFWISPLNAILVLLFIPFFILISNHYGEKLAMYGENTINSMKNCRGYIADLIELSFMERFRNKSMLKSISDLLNEYSYNKKKQVKTEAFFENYLSYAFLNFMIVLSLVISGIQVRNGQITLGSLYAIQLYVSKFWTPIEFFVEFYKEYATSKNVLSEFLDFFHVTKIEYKECQIDSIQLKDYVSLDNQGNGLHEPINAKLEPGTIHIFMGNNGIGKTSMALAMLGLSKRYQGEIILCHFKKNKSFLYSQANPVSSEFYSEGSLKEVSMGQLKIAQLDRDFSEDKQVYLFDEPTNYLDKAKKKYVREKLEYLASLGKIVIVITHDMDVVHDNDKIIFMEKSGKDDQHSSN